MAAIRRWLLAGLLVLVPLIITVWVLNWVVGTLDQTLQILPAHWQPDRLLGIHIPGFGVLLALVIVLLIGAIASNFMGRRLLSWWNALLGRIPIVRSMFSENGNAFRKALLVQWPRPGVWTIAFQTGTPGGDVLTHLGDDYLSVYVPTTPNPTGGYFVMLKRSDCIELAMTVDEALTYVISMGVVSPAPIKPH